MGREELGGQIWESLGLGSSLGPRRPGALCWLSQK